MSKKIWNLMFVAGNPELFDQIRSDPDNPLDRSEALRRFHKLSANGWHVWVEHAQTERRIAESDVQKNWIEKAINKQEEENLQKL